MAKAAVVQRVFVFGAIDITFADFFHVNAERGEKVPDILRKFVDGSLEVKTPVALAPIADRFGAVIELPCLFNINIDFVFAELKYQVLHLRYERFL